MNSKKKNWFKNQDTSNYIYHLTTDLDGVFNYGLTKTGETINWKIEGGGLPTVEVFGQNSISIDLTGSTGGVTISIDSNDGWLGVTTIKSQQQLIRDIDISYMVEMLTLWTHTGNDLTTIDVSNLTKLDDLRVYNNINLLSVDVSNNTLLTYFSGIACKFTSGMDFSNNSLLETLNVESCQLPSLNIMGCSALKTLTITNNPLTSLDLTTNTAIETFTFKTNTLMSIIDTSVMSNLKVVNFSSSTGLTSLNFINNTLLQTLYCYSCANLTDLRVDGLTELVNFRNYSVPYNGTVDFSIFTKLTYLRIDGDQPIVDISNNPNLATVLMIGSNTVTDFNIESCTSLSSLWIYDCSSFTAAMIDRVLIQSDAFGLSGKQIRYYGSGVPTYDANLGVLASPAAQTAYANLISRGYTILQ